MLINQKAVKQAFHSRGKRISKEALELLNAKLNLLIMLSVKAANGHETVLGRDVNNFSVRINR